MPRNLSDRTDRKRRPLRRLLERLEDRRLLAISPSELIWSTTPTPKFSADAPRPAEFAAFKLDQLHLATELETAPVEFSLGPIEPVDLRPGRSPGELSLPTPEGTLATFKLIETSIMDESLTKALSDVSTYYGFSTVDDASVRVTVSPGGLHATVRTDLGDYVVDPIIGDVENAYMSYYTSDVVLPIGDLIAQSEHDHDHDTDSSGSQEEDGPVSAPPDAQTTGTELRTYRFAAAATGEFTARHGGTVAGAQAAIVGAINDANGLYELEAGIRFSLIDNSSIVYTDAATDPYTNSSNSTMLGENQTNIDNVIGSANYDIGHVFGTAGGGVASVGVAGRNGSKARGVSSNNLLASTQTVAHEIGHQFGSPHTWNGANGSCSAAQWNSDFSMEPGSGTTIMSYGGFCGVDNVQTSRDFYFHSVSYDAIVRHAQNNIPTVGTITATGNTAPVVDAGLDYTIPALTPFELNPPAAVDAEGDPITYNWEQRDLGNGQKALAAPDDGLGPLFRSYPKDSGRTRTLPRLTNLLNNTVPLGEQLPSTDRLINFRLNANDGRGGTASDSIVIDVKPTGTPFAVTGPNTAVDWPIFSPQTVTWDVAGTTSNGIDVTAVNILLSTDGGNTFDIVLASDVPNDGSQDVTTPAVLTTTARIKVQPVDNIFFDISNTNFTISEPVLTTDFGDAPASYGVLTADNGASHIAGGPTLGASVDTEIDGQPSALATADGSDEDGLQFIDVLVAGETSNVKVTTPTGGELDMFIDFDGNGVFGNSSEEIIRTTLPVGDTMVPITIPASAVNNTFARLRISTAGGLNPTGPAADGEVEDHAVTIFSTAPGADFGDAQGYATTLADNGARHLLTGGPMLGTAVDAEPDALTDTMATADGRDDDGVVFRELLVVGQSTSVDVTASAAGVLDFFIDFDANGVFGNEINEIFSANLIAGTQAVSFDIPAGAVPGVTQSRFRLSTNGGLTPTGLVNDGEVEDYQVAIQNPAGEKLLEDFDSVVAPDLPLAWTSSQLLSSWATVSDTNDTAPNSIFVANEDSVRDVTLDSPPFRVEIPDTVVRFQNQYNTEETYDGGVLEISEDGGAFVDIIDAGGLFVTGGYDGSIDTQFGNPISGRDAWTGFSNGFIETAVQLPNSLVGKDVALRWRFGSDSSVSETGWWIDTVSYDAAPFSFDFGDAPDPSYPTVSASNGAAHVIGPVFLGSLVDPEADGQPTPTANGDDLAGLSDEDGVAFPASMVSGTNNVQIQSSADAVVNIWLDIDANGDWDSIDDHVIKDRAVTAGANTIPFELPPNAVIGNSVARIRLSNQAGLAPDGLAGDGEVEDHLVVFASGTSAAVESVQINDGSAQRSLVTSVSVTFDGITDVSENAFEISNRSDLSLVPTNVAFSTVNDKTVATITFSPGQNVVSRSSENSLIDGNFQLTVKASGVVGMGSDYRYGTTASDLFFRALGDSDGDRDVDAQDIGRFGQSYLKNSNDAAFNGAFDFDGDNDVDGLDYGLMKLKFQKAMPFN